MSTTTAPRPLLPPPLPADGRDAAPGLGRLTRVELRKAIDTRAGRWLLVAVAIASIAGIGLALAFSDPPDRTFAGLLGASLLPSSIVLPIVGILAVTSEWSQRTALSTFGLTPRRERVVAAKLLAAIVLGLAAMAVSLLSAAIANLIAIGFLDADGAWSITAAAAGQATLFALFNVLIGTAFGLLWLNSPLAIVTYFALPTVLGILTSTISAIEGSGRWLDTTRTFEPLTNGTAAGADWSRLGVSLALWLVLPMVIGIWRIRRSEIS